MTNEEIYNEGYKTGLEDAWKVAREIFNPVETGGMHEEELAECFGTSNKLAILRFPIAQEKELYDKWKAEKEQGKKEIHLGDVVIGIYGEKYVVLQDDRDGNYVVMGISNNDAFAKLHKSTLYKTGKHYDLPWVKNGTD